MILKYNTEEARNLKAYGELPESGKWNMNAWTLAHVLDDKGVNLLNALLTITSFVLDFSFQQLKSTKPIHSRVVRMSWMSSSTLMRFESRLTCLFVFFVVFAPFGPPFTFVIKYGIVSNIVMVVPLMSCYLVGVDVYLCKVWMW